MVLGSFTFAEWFVLVQHELLLFAAAFFALGMIDEFALDCTYVWMRLTGRIATPRLKEGDPEAITSLAGPAAVFIPTWREEAVIGPTLVHMLDVWPQPAVIATTPIPWRPLSPRRGAIRAYGW